MHILREIYFAEGHGDHDHFGNGERELKEEEEKAYHELSGGPDDQNTSFKDKICGKKKEAKPSINE